MRDNPFSKHAVAFIIFCGIAFFSLHFIIGGNDGWSGSENAKGTYSTSAVGYAGYYNILKKSGRNVLRSKGNSVSKAGVNGTLVLAEPDLRYLTNNSESEFFYAKRILVVLPKWSVVVDRNNPSHISSAELIKPDIPLGVFNAFSTAEAEIVRVRWPGYWDVRSLKYEPSGKGSVQLIKLNGSRSMRQMGIKPVVGNFDGILVGEIQENNRTIWIVSDPDVLSNHGLFQGKNLLFAVNLMDTISGLGNQSSGGLVVFDESIHGYVENSNSIADMMLSFPYVVVLILVFASGAMFVLSGSIRFGSPVQWVHRAGSGKMRLIENSTRLLDYTGHQAGVLKRYIRISVRSAAKMLHAPKMDDSHLIEWLDEIGRIRKVSVQCSQIISQSSSVNSEGRQEIEALLRSAVAIYKWKGEILNGASSDIKHSKKY